MATEDSDVETRGGIRRLFAHSSGKAASAPGAVSLKELISTAADKGIFAAIVRCAGERIAVAHPKAVEDEARELKERADMLRSQAVEQEDFDDAQAAADLYHDKLLTSNTLKSAILTLKSVITRCDKELSKCDKAMEYSASSKWKKVLVAAKLMLQPYVDEEARMTEEKEQQQRERDQASGTASAPLAIDDEQEEAMDVDDDLVPAEVRAGNARTRKVKQTKSSSIPKKRRHNHAGSEKAKKRAKKFTEENLII